jgi:hypothetical protein
VATTLPTTRLTTQPHSPLALWHLLSLDAPTIAALWTWFIAAANHIDLPTSSILAMGVAVWVLYAADRLLDAQSSNQQDLEARHLFHHHHRTAFLTGILFASIALAVLLPRLSSEAIRLYLILGGLLFGYFILIHATRSAHRLPKEIAVGIFFSAATFIPTVARHPALRLSLLPLALLFAALCSLNCLYIYAWEHAQHPPDTTHPTTRLALSNLTLITITVTTLAFLFTIKNHHAPWPISLAVALSALILLLLHKRAHKTPTITMRAAADLALTTPLLLIPFLK